MRRGLDYVWLSYYEEDCEGARPDWNDAFGRLADLFPAAALGIGECGASELPRRPGALRRCYGVSTTAPRFVGGGFWWHFSEDMVPSSKPLWTELARLISPPDAAGHDRFTPCQHSSRLRSPPSCSAGAWFSRCPPSASSRAQRSPSVS